jgi:hypothetical protein
MVLHFEKKRVSWWIGVWKSSLKTSPFQFPLEGERAMKLSLTMLPQFQLQFQRFFPPAAP